MASIPTVFIFSILAGAITFAAFFVMRRALKKVDIDEHEKFLDAMLTIVGTLVSILLGLLVASALERYQNLEQTVDDEASKVAHVFRLTAGLPVKERNDVRQLCIDYCMQVVDDEWPAMEKGTYSPLVLDTYTKLMQKVVTLSPTTEGESNVHAAMLASMEEASQARRHRLLALLNPWKQHLMPVLVMCTLILLAFALIYSRQGAMIHAIMIALVSIALGANLGLIILLSNPFAGDWRIRPTGFEINVRLWKYKQQRLDADEIRREIQTPMPTAH
jgi:hypothetical protein